MASALSCHKKPMNGHVRQRLTPRLADLRPTRETFRPTLQGLRSNLSFVVRIRIDVAKVDVRPPANTTLTRRSPNPAGAFRRILSVCLYLKDRRLRSLPPPERRVDLARSHARPRPPLLDGLGDAPAVRPRTLAAAWPASPFCTRRRRPDCVPSTTPRPSHRCGRRRGARPRRPAVGRLVRRRTRLPPGEEPAPAHRGPQRAPGVRPWACSPSPRSSGSAQTPVERSPLTPAARSAVASAATSDSRQHSLWAVDVLARCGRSPRRSLRHHERT